MALLDGLKAQVEARARVLAAQVADGVAAALREFPDVEISREGNALVLRGRGLMRRFLTEARFRFALRGWR